MAIGLVVAVGLVLISWAMQRTKANAVIAVDPRAAVGMTAEGHVMGSASAPVEIVEFGDFECPGCGQFATVTEPDVRERLVKTGQARFRFYPFQVTTAHVNTVAATLAGECAADQNKFWEMHDRLFQGQFDWNTQASANPTSIFKGYAKQLGLDQGAFDACYDTRKHLGRVAANAQEAERRGVRSTPTLIIGGQMLANGSPSYDAIKAAVDSAAKVAPAAAAAPPAADSGKR